MHIAVHHWCSDVSSTVLETSAVSEIFIFAVIPFLSLRTHTRTHARTYVHTLVLVCDLSFLAFILIILTCAFTQFPIPHCMP